jgi:hypothetical protein
MKKYTMIILMLAFVFAMGTSSVYADVGDTSFTATSITMGSTTSMVYNLSKNVYMQYGGKSSGTVVVAYGICTYHSSGDRVIGSGSADQKVYFQEVAAFTTGYTIGECKVPDDAATSNFAGAGGWSAL